jgi:hypothetical protein
MRSIEAVLAADFEATHREWATAWEAAKFAREQWERAVKDACKAGSPASILPLTAVEPDEPVRPRLMVCDATAEALAMRRMEGGSSRSTALSIRCR